jgi:multicomponent Na+:H+ antiporter subunit D
VDAQLALQGPHAGWAILSLAAPLIAGVLALLLPSRWLLGLVLVTSAVTALGGLGLAVEVGTYGPLRYTLGGWQAPLGIELHADGLAALMLASCGLVVALIALHATSEFRAPATGDARRPRLFWPLFFFLWGSLNAVFLAADLFNVYVALELMGLAAIPLVTLGGSAAALTAGMRYLLVAMLGSLMYLLGVALLYVQYGALDFTLLRVALQADVVTWTAAGVMTIGLLAKTALFPLHFWLPPAHSNAPAPASALLSALVVKASFYLVVRLWFDVLPDVTTAAAAQVIGISGAGAILWGSILALRQQRLKLLVAYSTVAQLGYLFIMFPLAGGAGAEEPWGMGAWSGGVLHAISHAFAKAAMFLVAGSLITATGHDRIDSIGGVAQHMPMAIFAFGLAGLTIMGLPPSGGFVAKWLLLSAAIVSGQWVWAVVMLVGGLLAAAYLFRVIGQAFLARPTVAELRPVPLREQLPALALAICSMLLGIFSYEPLALLREGQPAAAMEGLQ